MLTLAWITLIGLPLTALLCWSAVVADDKWWHPATAVLGGVAFLTALCFIMRLLVWALAVVVAGGAE